MLCDGGEGGRGTDCRTPRRWVSAPASASFSPALVSAAMLENSGGVGSGELRFALVCVCVAVLSLSSAGAAGGSPCF